jgi:hypothetical protein
MKNAVNETIINSVDGPPAKITNLNLLWVSGISGNSGSSMILHNGGSFCKLILAISRLRIARLYPSF